MVERKLCQELYSPAKIYENMFCAGSNENHICAGDSGGPVVYKNELVGIVSWGKGMPCPKNGISILTNVINYRDWIAKKTNHAVDCFNSNDVN